MPFVTPYVTRDADISCATCLRRTDRCVGSLWSWCNFLWNAPWVDLGVYEPQCVCPDWQRKPGMKRKDDVSNGQQADV